MHRSLCPDGLVFHPGKAKGEDPCDQRQNVPDKCEGRSQLQRPKPGSRKDLDCECDHTLFSKHSLMTQFSRALTCKTILAMQAMLTAHDRMECMRAMTPTSATLTTPA